MNRRVLLWSVMGWRTNLAVLRRRRTGGTYAEDVEMVRVTDEVNVRKGPRKVAIPKSTCTIVTYLGYSGVDEREVI